MYLKLFSLFFQRLDVEKGRKKEREREREREREKEINTRAHSTLHFQAVYLSIILASSNAFSYLSLIFMPGGVSREFQLLCHRMFRAINMHLNLTFVSFFASLLTKVSRINVTIDQN